MKRLRLTSIFFLVVAGMCFLVPASAYTTTSVGKDGRMLRWEGKEIEISISDSFMSPSVEQSVRENYREIIRKSFEAWSDAADVRFVFRRTAKANVNGANTSGDGISLITIAPTAENLLIFGERKTNVSAVTRLFYDNNGFITEADIVLNPTARFSTDGSRGNFDLQATLTHEIGHLLGLGHSGVIASTMHSHQGRNGVFGLPAIYPRTLSEDDGSGIRELYGPHPQDSREYGPVEVTLPSEAGLGTEVWLEEVDSGRVVAGNSYLDEGRINFLSIPVGNYRVFGQNKADGSLLDSSEIVRVSKEKMSFADLALNSVGPEKNVKSFGFNGQISGLAVPVETGRTYTFYFEASGVERDSLRVESSSEFLFVDPSNTTYLYSTGKSDVFAFEVSVSDEAEPGDYVFRVFEKDLLLGGATGVITVDDVQNPWYNAIFPVDDKLRTRRR